MVNWNTKPQHDLCMIQLFTFVCAREYLQGNTPDKGFNLFSIYASLHIVYNLKIHVNRCQNFKNFQPNL